ncbi:unnamed protein product [Phytophthora lilii]|uniref:Unnamed protein product n=1 Tax=Phytophthora lilii TaxID=2077276 RepID=A0A9W6TZ39_9STRA|nr:unnamed protein product [Phytophthora lilii]
MTSTSEKKFRPAEGEIHVLVVVPDKLENQWKRRRVEGAPGAWIKAIKDERVTALPSTFYSARNATGELDSALGKLFESKPHETISDITAAVLRQVIDPIESGSKLVTEDTYHHLWDSVIATLLRIVTDGSFHRSTNVSASTGAYRPDLCFYSMYSNVCVFRGEEKCSGKLDVPVKELHEKLTWRYDDAPYVFGYAAVGLLVCLVAIEKDEQTGRGAKLKRLKLLIEFAEDCVVKTYPASTPSNELIRNLKRLHCLMKKHLHPNFVELKNTNMKKKHVKLAPIGLLAPPKNVQQLRVALRDILKALVGLHAINLVHRDLRWENVLKSLKTESDKWFLIDIDKGTSSPAGRVTHLKAESHAPEILSSSSHTVKVDIWSVGYLLMTSSFKIFRLNWKE